MAKRNAIKLNHQELDALLKSPEVQKELEKRVSRAARAAGPGFESKVSVGRTRALAMVWAESRVAARRNAKHHTLMRVQDQMRG